MNPHPQPHPHVKAGLLDGNLCGISHTALKWPHKIDMKYKKDDLCLVCTVEMNKPGCVIIMPSIELDSPDSEHKTRCKRILATLVTAGAIIISSYHRIVISS